MLRQQFMAANLRHISKRSKDELLWTRVLAAHPQSSAEGQWQWRPTTEQVKEVINEERGELTLTGEI